MKIKKVFKFISKAKDASLKSETSIISRLRPTSTLSGRKKNEELKKIGRKKREIEL